MSLRAIVYAYVLGGLTFVPLLIFACIFYTVYTSVPVGDTNPDKPLKARLARENQQQQEQDDMEKDAAALSADGSNTESSEDAASSAADTANANANANGSPTASASASASASAAGEVNDLPKPRRGWLTVRRTFEELPLDGSYVAMVRSFLDARSKDPKRSRPRDAWYVVLKRTVLYLYEDESMTECGAAIELGSHDVGVFPGGLGDGELFTKRSAIVLRPRVREGEGRDKDKDREEGASVAAMPSVTREMALPLDERSAEQKAEDAAGAGTKKAGKVAEEERAQEAARAEALGAQTPWFIFVRSCCEMEDWYLALVHASSAPANTPTLRPLHGVFRPAEMDTLVATIDEQPDVIPMRWLNALLGRIFYSFYRTQLLESYIIGRLMRKLAKVKRPSFLSDIVVTEFSVGNHAPLLSKPMLKELTKEGDAALEVHVAYKGEIRATVQATAIINLGSRFKSYTVKLVLAVVLRELEGNLLVKVKRPPSSRIWYAFTQTPRMVLNVEPIVSDRQITWSMILNQIEARLIEVIQESIVMPNMDDISFFDSSQFMHRGGIWSDARRTKVNINPADYAGDEDQQSKNNAEDPSKPTELKHSHSAEEMGTDGIPVENETIARSATVGEAAPATASARRRSWFGKENTEDTILSTTEEDSEGDERGRNTTPKMASDEDVTQEVQVNEPDTHDVEDEPMSPPPPPRSPSVHSVGAHSRSSRAHSISSSVGGDESASYLSDSSGPGPSSASASARSNSNRNSSSIGPTTSSFLNALKSKAGDKQALSNSAKEAMRKWGVNVNWGGLKNKDTPTTTVEDTSDGGGESAGDAPVPRTGDSRRSFPSFAEIKAAVADRNAEYQHQHQGQTNGDSIPTPSSNNGKARTVSTSSTRSTGSHAGSSTLASGGESSSGSARTIASATPLSRSANESFQDRDRDVEGAAEAHRPPPIFTQQPTQAKGMMIPGIHAKHRGEVMSLGNVAPASPAPEEKAKVAAATTTTASPAIQSVYRLWKSPTMGATGAGGSSSTGNGNAQQDTTPRPDAGERNKDVAPLTLSPSPSPEFVAHAPASAPILSPPAPAATASSPRVPPPLPPRSVSSTVTRTATPASTPAILTQQPASASDALKSIASKDEGARHSREGAASPTSPASVGSGEAPSVDGGINGAASAAARPVSPPASASLPPRPDNRPPLPPRKVPTIA
ncbi:hypothetical protein CONPUDRAFT_149142 [Coniophora puteana RWD-64-598 SS2]|uniref:SMP-LTD domain-containing protein n=1 Tax=Coniophora puteana (strain RWD-64-598) TaxID=741705 RepID=A0A5M3N8B9_CONPW|nr:uncharacterized protein CONPUDRAFT_149142 [Coniophora puteana RWD-64-598 SS2]EIW87101.1 hypothetical protein CONPUDRAFT_149142 [Coniophora puteana RWD-64-598 SS2]